MSARMGVAETDDTDAMARRGLSAGQFLQRFKSGRRRNGAQTDVLRAARG